MSLSIALTKGRLEKQTVAMLEELGYGVEALKDNLSGFWSRRIDKFNRMVYTIDEEIITVFIISAKGHYGEK